MIAISALFHRLVTAPHIEAKEIIDKLTLQDERTLRFWLFTLRKYIKDGQFATEFLHRDALRELIDIINTTSGNMLAYALTGMQDLMELETGWSSIYTVFIYKVVQILANPNNLINVCRPASAILKKLVEADSQRIPNLISGSGSRNGPLVPQSGSLYRFGFDVA
jgi:engulfment/cell motility protein 1